MMHRHPRGLRVGFDAWRRTDAAAGDVGEVYLMAIESRAGFES